ncbi:hypothetical protein [Sulfuricurvum sp.]|uniref:hypothetical protein n=1 Tax=Sulfuricurvum sp. TaxID=2025608 RepID=UPI003568FA7B
MQKMKAVSITLIGPETLFNGEEQITISDIGEMIIDEKFRVNGIVHAKTIEQEG